MKKYLYFCLLLATVAANTKAQTLKALSYDVSNNTVVAATNTNPITFRNPIAWATNSHRIATRVALGVPSSLGTGSNSVIGGGLSNQATGIYSVVSGGLSNTASGNPVTVNGTNTGGGLAFVGGGDLHVASGWYSAIVGGHNNEAKGWSSFIGGGNHNTIEVPPFAWDTNYPPPNSFSAIVGGLYNTNSGYLSIIGGGIYNKMDGQYGVIGGGSGNEIRTIAENYAASFSVIPGGRQNIISAGNAFAAGSYATAAHEGAFVWSDNSSTNSFSSTNNNSFNIRAHGGLSLDLGTNGIAFRNPTNAAVTRTNLGLSWDGLTNPSAATFRAALFDANNNPILVNTNGAVVNPTNLTSIVFNSQGITVTNSAEFTAIGGSASLFQVSTYLGVGWKTGGEFSKVRIFADGIYSGSGLATNKIISLGLGSPFWRLETAPSLASGVAANFLGNLGLTNGGSSINVNGLTAGFGNIGQVEFIEGNVYGEIDDNDGFRSFSLSPDNGLSFGGDNIAQAKENTRTTLGISSWSTSIAAHHATALSPAAGGQTYYVGFPHDGAAVTTSTERGFRFPFAGKIIAATATISVTGSVGTNQSTNFAIGIYNKTTATTTSFAFTNLSWTNAFSARNVAGLDISVNTTNDYTFYVTTPTFSNAPTSVRHYITLFYQPN